MRSDMESTDSSRWDRARVQSSLVQHRVVPDRLWRLQLLQLHARPRLRRPSHLSRSSKSETRHWRGSWPPSTSELTGLKVLVEAVAVTVVAEVTLQGVEHRGVVVNKLDVQIAPAGSIRGPVYLQRCNRRLLNSHRTHLKATISLTRTLSLGMAVHICLGCRWVQPTLCNRISSRSTTLDSNLVVAGPVPR
jgi:hypothetical protein